MGSADSFAAALELESEAGMEAAAFGMETEWAEQSSGSRESTADQTS